MKRIFLSFLVTFALMIMTNVESMAQCQSGYTNKKVQLTIAGCNYEVEICYQCGVHNAGEVYIIGVTLLPNQSCTALPLNDFIDQLYNIVNTYQFIYLNLCTSLPQLAPCPYQSEQVITYIAKCWEVELIEYFSDTTYVYKPCDDTPYCKEVSSWCYVFPSNPVQYQKTIVSRTYINGTECSDEWWELVLPTQLNQVSNCVIYPNIPCQ